MTINQQKKVKYLSRMGKTKFACNYFYKLCIYKSLLIVTTSRANKNHY